MKFQELDDLIKQWKLADAKKEISLSESLSEDEVFRLLENIRVYEACESELTVAVQSSPEDGFQQLKNHPNQQLIKSHKDYDSIHRTLSTGIETKIDQDLAEANEKADELNFEDAESLLENAENLVGLLEDPVKISQVHEQIQQVNKRKEAEDLINKIYAALNAGVPTIGFKLLHQLESLAIKKPEIIEKIRTELEKDEIHRMGQSTRSKATTDYENIVNVRRSLEESTKYRLKYNAEIRYQDLAELRQAYLEKELSIYSDQDDYRAKLATELDTIKVGLPKSRKLSEDYYVAAIRDVREKVKLSIESAQKHLDLGNYSEAAQSLEIARNAGKPDEKFAGFVEDRLLEIPLENHENQWITEIENDLTVKAKKRLEAEKLIDRAKTLLSQNSPDYASITRAKHDLDQISQDDPNLPGLRIVTRKIEEKISNIQLRQRVLLEMEIRSLSLQWHIDDAQQKLIEITPLCSQEVYQELESQLRIQMENQRSARLYKVEFEQIYEEMLDSLENAGLDNLKAFLEKWLVSADQCEAELIMLISFRKKLEKYIQKYPELSENKRILERVLQDAVKPNPDSNAAAYSLASSIVKEQPGIMSLLTRYWIKVADETPDYEAEIKLKILQSAKEVVAFSHDNKLLKLVDGRIKEIQNKTADGQYANQILERVTPLLEGDKPRLQEAGRILGGIPSNHPIKSYPSIRDLLEKKERLSKNESARIQYMQARTLVNDNDKLEQLIKILKEVLEIDPDNFEYQQTLVQAQFDKDDDDQLAQKISKYLIDISNISMLNEIEAFLKGVNTSTNKKYSANVRSKVESLKQKAAETRADLDSRLENFERKVNNLINNNQFDEAQQAFEKENLPDLHPDQYIKFENLKSKVENKIELAALADKKLIEAEAKAASANFAGALRQLTGEWDDLPNQKKDEVNNGRTRFIYCDKTYREAGDKLDELSTMMQDLKISFKLQNDVNTKVLSWNGPDDLEVKMDVQRTYMALKGLNLPQGLPKDDAVYKSYDCISSILDSLDAIEQNSPNEIPGESKNRKEQLKQLDVRYAQIFTAIRTPIDNIKHLQTHRSTNGILIKCQQNTYFRQTVYKIKDDLQTLPFLAYISGVWRKHGDDLRTIKTQYHFPLDEVDND